MWLTRNKKIGQATRRQVLPPLAHSQGKSQPLASGWATAPLVLSLVFGSCAREVSPPPSSEGPPGSPKRGDTRVLEQGASILQNRGPAAGFEQYLNGFHVMKDNAQEHREAHHYCRGLNEEFTQCVLFDGDTEQANLVGIEYIVSERLFATLPADEKNSWHPHNYEILSGQLVMPGIPEAAEKRALEKKLNSYGKTWHVWATGHGDAPSLPVGPPRLAWSYNQDGEIPAELLQARDERMDIETLKKREARADLEPLARPQQGQDALRGKIGPPRLHPGEGKR